MAIKYSFTAPLPINGLHYSSMVKARLGILAEWLSSAIYINAVHLLNFVHYYCIERHFYSKLLRIVWK